MPEEDLKWPLSMVEHRKLPPSVQKETEKREEKKKSAKLTPVIVEYCSALGCQNITRVCANNFGFQMDGSESQSKQIMCCLEV